jgi:predicted  nucleic acid-binding Zn-ribbon protein
MQVLIKEEMINQLSTEIETLRDQGKDVEEKVSRAVKAQRMFMN